MKALPLSFKKKSNILHLLFATYKPGSCAASHGTASITHRDHKLEFRLHLSSAQQIYNGSRETIFGTIPLWIAIITQECTKLLIAEYQLFAVPGSERVADFMDIQSCR